MIVFLYRICEGWPPRDGFEGINSQSPQSRDRVREIRVSNIRYNSYCVRVLILGEVGHIVKTFPVCTRVAILRNPCGKYVMVKYSRLRNNMLTTNNMLTANASLVFPPPSYPVAEHGPEQPRVYPY